MDKILRKLVWFILLVPTAYLVISWKTLPASVVMHFNWKGEADRFGDKNELGLMVLALTGVSLLVYLLLLNIQRIDPKRYAKENNDRMQRLGFGMVVFIAAIQCMIIFSSIHGNLNFRLMLPALGLLFAFIGNYMPNIKPNYFAGFRLPWTLENEENWRKTHLLVGKLWFSGGLLTAVLCIFLPAKPGFIVFIGIMTIITIIPIIYSYRLFLEQKKRS
jgi:uncharacterized membrane protein